MGEKPELLPCPNPWCDPYRERIIHWELGQRQVFCTCGVKGPCGNNDEEAIAAWNTRSHEGREGLEDSHVEYQLWRIEGCEREELIAGASDLEFLASFIRQCATENIEIEIVETRETVIPLRAALSSLGGKEDGGGE